MALGRATGTGLHTYQVDDGWADAPIGDDIYTKKSTAKRLYSQDSNGQSVITVKLPIGRADALLTSSTTGPNTGPASEVWVAANNFTSDDRSARISRARSSNPLLLANEPNLDKKKDDWIEPDGTMHGHTRYSYEYETDPFPSVYRSDQWQGQSFVASRFGTWVSPWDYWWNPTGGVTGNLFDNDSIDGSLQRMPKGSLYKDVNGNWMGTKSSSTELSHTYTVQDRSDGVKATATYNLMMHDEWDNKRPNPVTPFDVYDKYIDFTVSAGAFSPSGVRPFLQNNNNAQTLPYHWSWSGSVEVSASAALSGGFKLSDAFNFGLNLTGGGKADSSSGVVGDYTLSPLKWTFPEYHVHYHRNHYLIDHFVASGFDGFYDQVSAPSVIDVGLGWHHEMDIGTSFPPSQP